MADCAHKRVEWSNKKPIQIANRSIEILAASGFLRAFAKWNAHCVECGRAILWASNKPRLHELDSDGYFRKVDATD